MITHADSGTAIDEIATGIYRINTPVTPIPGGFSFNRYLVVDDEPLLFHTGPRGMFELTRQAIAAVMPIERLRWIGFSHHENDEDGAMNELLAAASAATPLCGRVSAMLNAETYARATRPRRRRDADAREPRGALARHATPAARLGVRLPLRDVEPHAPLR